MKRIMVMLLMTGLMISTVLGKSEAKEQSNHPQIEDTQPMQTQAEDRQFLNIGSVSKVYVVAAVMQLADQGKIDIDAPVTEYIPEFRLADERYMDITVRMLMNHTSGLMGTVYAGAIRFDDRSSEYHDSFLTILSKERLKNTPGEYNCYCNDGFTLLEMVVERVSNMTFTEYMEKNITAPLGLYHTGTMWNVPSFDHQAPSYIDGDIKTAPECVQLIGAGGIMADANELCTFGSAFFKGNKVLLSEKAKNQMTENQAIGFSKECFGLGWDEVSIPDYSRVGVKVIQKGGDTFSQHASLTVAPEEEISIAVVSSGGSSAVNEELAGELLDIALLEKGIEVEHVLREVPEMVNRIPEEIKYYEGQYTKGDSILDVSFPDDKYMLIRSLAESAPFEVQYLHTEEGSFIKVSGDVESGNAIPVKPVDEYSFETVNGRDFMKDANGNYVCERITERTVGDTVQNAWDDRNGVTYYCSSLHYNDALILQRGLSSVTLNTYDEVRGYVNGCVIIDENHAENRTNIPGSASRDTSDMEISKKDGCEILTLTDTNISYVSEKNISDYSGDITEVETKSKSAVWLRLNGIENETVRFDIPGNAAVYVFDKFGNVKYTNYMMNRDYCVPLPEYGMIVFMGDTGAKIRINR